MMSGKETSMLDIITHYQSRPLGDFEMFHAADPKSQTFEYWISGMKHLKVTCVEISLSLPSPSHTTLP
jgi:hypothetical protein